MPTAPTGEELVRDIPAAITADVNAVAPEAPISRVVELLRTRPQSRMVYVVDAERRLVGTVSWRDVLRVTKARIGAREPGFFSMMRLWRDIMPETAADVMRKATPVGPETPLREALVLMDQTRQNDLPLVDDATRLVGELNGMHIMALALDVFRQTEADLAAQRERQQ